MHIKMLMTFAQEKIRINDDLQKVIFVGDLDGYSFQTTFMTATFVTEFSLTQHCSAGLANYDKSPR